MASKSAVSGNRFYQWLLGGGALCFLALILWPQILKLPVPDESTFIYEGWRVARGELPYRDFFEFIGPGTLYWVALHIKLFGLSLAALRISVILSVLAGMGLTVYLARPFLSRPWIAALLGFLLGVYIPGGFVVQHHLYSSLLALAAVAALTQAMGAKSPARWWALAGMLTGLCSLFTQSLGGLMGMALCVFLLLYLRFVRQERWGRAFVGMVATFILPALLPVLAVAVYFWTQGGLDALIYSMFTWLVEGNYARTTSNWYLLDATTRMFSLWQSTALHPILLVRRPELYGMLWVSLFQGFLPVLGLLWAGQVVTDRFARRGMAVQPAAWTVNQGRFLLLLLASLAYFAANFSYPNTVLVGLHGWTQYLLAFMALAWLSRRYPPSFGWIRGLVLSVIAFQIYITAYEAWRVYENPRVISYGTVEKQLMAVGLDLNGAHAVNAMFSFLHAEGGTGENLFVYNGAPEFYLLTGLQNPTRYQILMSVYNTPAQIREAVADLRRKKPMFIIYNQLDRLNFERDLRFKKLRGYDYRLQALEALLAERYQLAGQLQNILLFQRVDQDAGVLESPPH